jgi:flavin reductase (DIM6/NTAB) family NADH-FMN oxidoreductase RutF
VKIREIPYNQELGRAVEQLRKGAFLTVKSGDVVNTMAAGWCMAGYMWNRPIFQILVMTSRYTYDLIENGGRDFTLSFPLSKDMGRQLAYCGSKSGRGGNKAEACGLAMAPSMKVSSPIVADCDLHYECKIVASQKFPVEDIDNPDAPLQDGHYHVMYYGEIVACYMTEP